MFEAKVATISRPGVVPMISSSASVTRCSEGVKPSVSAFVESERSSSTPAIAQRAQLGDIGQLAVHRVLIELVVGGVDDQADGRGHRHAHGIRDAVADVEELHREAAEIEHIVGRDGVQLGVGQQTRLLQLDLGQAACQRRGVDGHIQVLEQIRAGRRCGLRGRGSG